MAFVNKGILKMKYNLLIWELVPEETQLFLVPAELGNKLLLTANNCFINHTELSDEQDEALDKINQLLSPESSHDGIMCCITPKGDWFDFKVEPPIQLKDDDSIIGVYICGFIL